MDQAVVLATLIIYKAVLIGIGFWASRRTSDDEDFFIGGRGLGPWVAGLSYAASTSSAWVLLGFSGFVYAVGVSALWMVPGIWLGYVGAWLWIGPRIRAAAETRNHVTLTDYVTQDMSGASRVAAVWLACLFILFCFTFYIGAQFQAAGQAFADTFNLGAVEAIFIGAAVILVYALLGGFWAVSLTDTLQGAMMGIVATVLPILAVIAAGGPLQMIATLRDVAPLGFFDWTGGHPGVSFAFFVAGLMAVGAGTFGQPQLMNRLMAVKDDASRRQGFAIAMSWGVAVFIGMAMLAFAGRALTPELTNAEGVFYAMTSEVLPSILAGIVLAAVLSAVMSTVDSTLLAAAAAVAHDLDVSHRVPGSALFVSRLVMTAICVLSIALTLLMDASIFNRALFAWTALGAAFGPIVMVRALGLKPPGWSVVASMMIGFVLAVAFNQVFDPGPGAFGERFVPWIPTLALLIVASKMRWSLKGASNEV